MHQIHPLKFFVISYYSVNGAHPVYSLTAAKTPDDWPIIYVETNQAGHTYQMNMRCQTTRNAVDNDSTSVNSRLDAGCVGRQGRTY
jgi:hypothetical protein